MVWDTPEDDLLALIMLKFVYLSITEKNSLSILTLLPIEIYSGTYDR